MQLITKDIIIGDLLTESPDMAGVLMGAGMHCIGCPASQAESVEEAAIVHGFDPDEFVTVVNDYVRKMQMVHGVTEGK